MREVGHTPSRATVQLRVRVDMPGGLAGWVSLVSGNGTVLLEIHSVPSAARRSPRAARAGGAQQVRAPHNMDYPPIRWP